MKKAKTSFVITRCIKLCFYKGKRSLVLLSEKYQAYTLIRESEV